jgi:hypothetical protein
VAASPWNYRSSGCAVGGDLLECSSQQISLDIQLSGERKIIWVKEIILVTLNVKESEFRVKFEVSTDYDGSLWYF